MIPADKLEVDSVLCHELDFPVGNFRESFVVPAENGFVFIIGRDVVPAPVITVSPEVADIHTYIVIVCACRNFGFGGIVCIFGDLFYYYIVYTEFLSAVIFGGNINSVESICLDCERNILCNRLSAYLDLCGLLIGVCVYAYHVPHIFAVFTQLLAVCVHLAVLCRKGNNGSSAACECDCCAVSHFGIEHYELRFDFAA